MSRRLLVSYLSLALFALLLLEIPLAISYARNQRHELTIRLERDAVAMASFAEDALEQRLGTAAPALRELAERYRRDTGGRAVIVDARGTAIVDTSPPEPGERSFASRPEIARALEGEIATGTRSSQTLATDLFYVAVPVSSSGRVHGAVRLTYPTAEVDRRVRRYWLLLAAVGAVVLAVTTAVGLALARTVAKPLSRLEQAAEAAGEGDLGVRAAPDGPPEVRSLARRFNEMAEKLQALLRSQEAFVADASHQLRTPLAALRLRLENLERDVRPSGREDLEAALGEVERLTRLVDGLLALAGADRAEPGEQTLNLAQIVSERVDAWAPLAEERGVSLEGDVDPAIGARGTAERLEQSLDNLIENALEASPPGTTIEIWSSRRERWAELHVLDQGPGMTAEQRERAFDRFWRARAGEGTGLGLAIARRLVRADGGEVELLPANGGGTDAVVRLRASVTSAAPVAPPAAERRAGSR